jgi:hypothetical protein
MKMQLASQQYVGIFTPDQAPALSKGEWARKRQQRRPPSDNQVDARS